MRWFDLDGNVLQTRAEFERQRGDALELQVKALKEELERRGG